MTQERILPAAAAPASRPLLPPFPGPASGHPADAAHPAAGPAGPDRHLGDHAQDRDVDVDAGGFPLADGAGADRADRDVHLGGGAGRALGPALGESSVRRDPPALHRRHAAAGSGRRAGRDRAAGHAHQRPAAASGRLTGGAAALHRPCGPSVAHAAVRPAAGVRADAGAAAAGRCARGPSASRRSATA